MDIFVVGLQTSFASVFGVLFSVLCLFSVRSFFMLIGMDKANTCINYLLLESVLSFICIKFELKYISDMLDVIVLLLFIGVVLFQLISAKRIWQEYVESPLSLKTICWCLSICLVSFFMTFSLAELLLLGKGMSLYRLAGGLVLLCSMCFLFGYVDIYLKTKGKLLYKQNI